MLLKMKQLFIDQDSLLKNLIVCSVLVHIVIFTVSYLEIDPIPRPPMEEWVIDTDLSSDFGDSVATKTVIPNAKLAEKASVPSNLLPQINKSFKLRSKSREDDGISESISKIEKSKIKGKKVEGIDRAKKEKSRLKMKDALRRLALEKLRKQQKTKSTKYRTEQKAALARVRQNLSSNSKRNGLGGVAEENKYKAYLERTISRNYDLPTTYKIKKNQSKVHLNITINAKGTLKSAKIKKSSGDKAYDSYTMVALRKSVPFSKPPASLVGRSITLMFGLR